MLSKLMKYEFKSSFRNLGIIWLAMIGMAAIVGAFGRVTIVMKANSGMRILDVLEALSTFIYGCLIAVAVVITAMIIIRRFKNGLLGDEGYLMHTLPVSKGKLIASKGLVAAVVLIISIVAIAFSIVLLNTIVDPSETAESVKDFFGACGSEPRLILFGFEGLILSVMFILIIIYKVYAALSIGQLSDNRRGLIAIGAYLGINVILSVLGIIISVFAFKLCIWNSLFRLLESLNEYKAAHAGFLMIFLALAVLLVVLHFVTESILSKKLNLQ